MPPPRIRRRRRIGFQSAAVTKRWRKRVREGVAGQHSPDFHQKGRRRRRRRSHPGKTALLLPRWNLSAAGAETA